MVPVLGLFRSQPTVRVEFYSNYSLTEMVSAGAQMTQLNALRRNEFRNWVGMPPDAEMDDLLVLENYLQQKDLVNQKKLIQDET